MKSWPHAPSRAVHDAGTYFVATGTLDKLHYFKGEEALAFLEDSLLELALEFGWQLEAWAVFPNHYHFVGRSPEGGSNLHKFTGKLHGIATRWVNRRDGTRGRQVWFSYYPVKLTYERSYLARLNYVIQNPVRHGVVLEATQYPYCSAAWFEQHADSAWYQTVSSFPIDNVHVEDDF